MMPKLEKHIARQRVYWKRRIIVSAVLILMVMSIVATVSTVSFKNTGSPTPADSPGSVVEKAKQAFGLPAHKKYFALRNC